jgi:thiamine biosynthesis lipoprotein ApbE
MDKIWKFDGSMTAMPTPEEIKKSVAKVGYKNIFWTRKITLFSQRGRDEVRIVLVKDLLLIK